MKQALLFILITVALLLSTCDAHAKKEKEVYNGIIRLHDRGEFFCSGFVISDTIALTAEHCIDQYTPYIVN